MVHKKPFRTAIELVQTYEKHQGFTHTTSSDNPEDVLLITIEEGNKISLRVDFFDAYVEFDGDAQSDGTSMLIPVNTGYDEDGIFVIEKISMKNVIPGKNARLRGIIWGR